MTDNTPDPQTLLDAVNNPQMPDHAILKNTTLGEVRAALDARLSGKHQREEPHHYDIVCRTCGQPGTLRVSVDPNFPDPDLIAKIDGEFH